MCINLLANYFSNLIIRIDALQYLKLRRVNFFLGNCNIIFKDHLKVYNNFHTSIHM